MLCITILTLLKTLRITSFPLRLNTTPQRNISCICLSKTLLSHSSRFLRTSCLSSSVTTLVDSMFFRRNSLFLQTILLRVKSMRFLCCSQPFESFLRLNTTEPCCSIPLLFIAFPFYYLTFLSLIYQASRLNRFFCNQVSDSLAVYSSHRGNLCSRC